MKYLEILPSHLVMLLNIVLKCMMANGEAGRFGCTPYVGLCCIWKRFALQRKSDDFDVFVMS